MKQQKMMLSSVLEHAETEEQVRNAVLQEYGADVDPTEIISVEFESAFRSVIFKLRNEDVIVAYTTKIPIGAPIGNGAIARHLLEEFNDGLN